MKWMNNHDPLCYKLEYLIIIENDYCIDATDWEGAGHFMFHPSHIDKGF